MLAEEVRTVVTFGGGEGRIMARKEHEKGFWVEVIFCISI